MRLDCGQSYCPSYHVLMKNQDLKECHDCDCPYCPFKIGDGKLQLILKGFWYDQIDRGTKNVEYRDNTPFWRRRILTDAAYRLYDDHKLGKTLSLPLTFLKHSVVVFHLGYVKPSMAFKISEVRINDVQIEIHLGERMNNL